MTHPAFRDSCLPARFWDKIRIDASGCWEWEGARSHKGYARFQWYGSNAHAHRVAFTMLVGPIGAGLELDHLCRNRACVNPAHLEAVEHATNVRRAVRPVVTHCVNGHPFSPENTYVSKRQRHCRTCRRLHDEQRRKRLQAQARAAR